MRALALFLLIANVGFAEIPDLQVASLGSLTLESGEVLADAKLGYRTDGELNTDKSNAILFPTWFSGTTEDLFRAGAVESIDREQFFLITVGAFGNGVSSSPSNSDGLTEVTIRDMVNAQHRLVTEVLGLDQLHAVVGISMGGMQTFEWMIAFPDFMTKAVPIAGSPRLASYDILLWEAELEAIALARQAGDAEKASGLVGMISALALQSPPYHARQTPRAQAGELLRLAKAGGSQSMADRELQLRAMINHDVTRAFGGSMEAAAEQ